MSRLAIDDMFYGKPERVRYSGGSRGGSGSYGGYQLDAPHYYSDGDDCYSHRYTSGIGGRAPVYANSVTSRPTLPDVRLSVPMDSLRCVEKLKEALDISGVYSIHCDIPTQTVTVSGNVAPQALLKRAKHVKRKAKILSYTNLYTDHQYPHHHSRTSSATATYAGTMSPVYGSSSNYYRTSVSPPRDHHVGYNYSHSHSLGGYSDQHRRPSHEHHFTHYY